ncbi:uncharacterized protein LOC133294490 [Gastrolobium bilobum]|uniref:uncharacterized protein LOC133294490 n=1 Tax=Gastrolobium bilobum TaxID=150636 RepID=UPI002AB18834|nr:uncharacterized protein LOC133294490 [Gastrolobium bilobum]
MGKSATIHALICAECPTAYYVHCSAHRLQLALVAASHEVKHVHQFFEKLNFIINIVTSSCKRNDELRVAQGSEIARMITIDELKSGVGLNQIGTLHRAGATRWSSYYNSICSLFKMFKATCEVLDNISNEGKTTSHRGDADNAYSLLTSFDFIILCQALQRMSKDILNALHLVSTTKELLQKLREIDWEAFLVHVQEFCIKHDIDIPNVSAKYIGRRSRAQNEQDLISLSTTSELCQGLARTGKSIIYLLIDRVIRLVLTLPAFTATTERSFSAIKIIMTRL